MLQYLFRLDVLGVDHQPAGVAVQPMHNVGGTLLPRLLEIVIEHRLHVQARVPCCHREYADLLLDHDQPLVLVHDLHVAALESLLVPFRIAHRHPHAPLQGEVKLAHGLAVHLDAPPLQRRLDF